MMHSPMTSQEAIAVAYRAARCLRGFRPNPRRGLEIIKSVPVDAEFAGADRHAERITRGALCAVRGDCYRRLGEPATAADWYRRAAGHRKGGLGYPFLYADLVVEHRLTEHYRTALDCLRDEEAHWRAKPLLHRFLRSVSGLWWLYPSYWKQQRRERTLGRRLEALLRGQEGVG